tara:strand:- start:2461 stop:2937 length:477 start_codon:yes stop_codon:yes gene_type:complete
MSDKKNTNRTSRAAEMHDKETRRKPWKPVKKLDTPPPPAGYEYRWIRESILGQEDRNNVSYRLREGWDLVRGEELPAEWKLPTLESGRHTGVVYNEGLLLAKIPVETVEERRQYYAAKTADRDAALDNNMFRDASRDSRYVKYDPSRDSRVSFGKQDK